MHGQSRGPFWFRLVQRIGNFDLTAVFDRISKLLFIIYDAYDKAKIFLEKAESTKDDFSILLYLLKMMNRYMRKLGSQSISQLFCSFIFLRPRLLFANGAIRRKIKKGNEQ